MAQQLATEHRHYLPESLLDGRGGYRFEDFQDFLKLYDQVGGVVRTARDLERLATDYLLRCAATGTRYVELMLSPDHSEDNGIALSEQLDAVALGIQNAERHGIRAGVIVTAVRHKGPDAAIDLAENLADLDHPIVCGFGLTGNEHLFDVKDFAGAFYVARELGLGLTAHTGEWLDGDSVIRSISELGLNRIGHGCSIVEHPAILERVANLGVGIEVCLSSNLMLGRVHDLTVHPIIKMLDAGCLVSLATDDPGYFHTSPAREYRLAQHVVGLDSTQIAAINMNGISTAFCSDDTKKVLREHLPQ